MKRIHDSLSVALHRHRIVFWYDATGEWTEAFSSFGQTGVKKLTVDGTEFGAKVAMHRDPESSFLVYLPSPRPADADNWLLDFLLQGHEYKADRASLALQDVGLPYELRPVVEAHIGFFDSAERAEALKERIGKDEEPASLRRKMMGVAAGATAANIDAVLLAFSSRTSAEQSDDLLDPIKTVFGDMNLLVPFWREVEIGFGFRSENPTLRDFIRSLFRASNPLDQGTQLTAHGQVFLQQWKDSNAFGPSYRAWATAMERELNLEHQLDALEDMRALGSNDTFPLVERYVVCRLCGAYESESLSAEEILKRIQQRRNSFWYADHAHGYAALEQVITLRELIRGAELSIDSIESGLQRYASSWFKVDTAYRKFHFHQRAYGQVKLFAWISQQVDKSYLANFLLPLADRWGDQISKMTVWPGEVPTVAQADFYAHHVQPYVEKGQKLCVIISDALRYEAAVELMERLLSENRWKADLETMLGVLPSYTQLGMAALLPGKVRAIDAAKRTVSIDSHESAGTENRREILRNATEGRATALSAVEFMEMNTTTDARALIRDHDIVYLYHDVIDDTGDKLKTEAQTTEAVEEAIVGLIKLLKKVANANGGQVLLTADHGFLFQQNVVASDDDLPLPPADEWLFTNRRFAIGRGIQETKGAKLFGAEALGLSGDWTAAFPYALGRFPLKASGKRFVHGGFSLQEVVLPVLRVHKTRSDDTGRVDVDLLRAPSKITTGRLSLVLYQDRATTAKLHGRTLRVGIFAADGTAISGLKTVKCESAERDARRREIALDLALSMAADPHNGKEVEIRLEEFVGNNPEPVPYKIHRLKLQKPFTTDFDEF